MNLSRTKLGNVVAWLGLCIGLVVSVVVPAQFPRDLFNLDHENSLLVNSGRGWPSTLWPSRTWQYQTLRLGELTEIPEARVTAAQQRIVDATGELVLATGEAPTSPAMVRSRPVIVSNLRVATIEMSTTLRPTLIATAVISAFSCLLGIAVFFVIRVVPQRIIDQTIVKLEATQERLLATIEAIPIEFVSTIGTSDSDQQRRTPSQGGTQFDRHDATTALEKNSFGAARKSEQDWDSWMTDARRPGQTGRSN